MGDHDERCAPQLVVANQGAQLHNGPVLDDTNANRLMPHCDPDPAETSFVSLSSLPSPFTVQNEHAILVLVNDQAERTDTSSWGASLPRVHRLARKAPLADDDDQEMHDVARWYSLDLRTTPRRQTTRSSLRVPAQSQPNLGNHVHVSPSQKATFGAALRDPFYLMRQRMVEPKQHEALNRIKKAVNKMMGFMFSHLGLFLVVVVYAMLGGIMFPPMEKDTEIARRQQLETRTKNMSESLLEIIYNVSLRLLSSTEYHVDGELLHMCALIQQHELDRHAGAGAATPEEYRRKRSLDTRSQSAATLYAKFAYLWKRKHDAELKKLVEEHISTFKREVYTATVNGWDGETIDKQTQWTFAGSTLYSITVITTIGYGHLVPRTLEGRVVTILYALVGIPLTLLCVASMGSLFASMFRETYMYFYVRWCAPRVRIRRDDSKKTSRLQTIKMRLMPWHTREHHQVLAKCLYNSAVACGNIGTRKIEKHEDQCSTLQAIKRDGQKLLFRQKVRVPVYITLLGIIFYMLLGASMFSIWEGWTFFEAFYFSFITLSTIGFGDYVPGTTLKQQEEDSQGKLVLCCLYLIFGLGMMSMTIQLMQDSVKESFIAAAQKLGIFERKDNSITAQTKEKNIVPPT